MKYYLLPVALILLQGCHQAQQAVPRKQSVTLVEVATVSRSPLVAYRILTGSLQAVSTVRLFNEEEGRIVSLPYYQGDAVEKDAILARIDDSLIQAELKKAKANLKQARVDVKRIKCQTTARRNIPFAAIRYDSQGEFLFRIRPDNTVESVRV